MIPFQEGGQIPNKERDLNRTQQRDKGDSIIMWINPSNPSS